MALNLQILKTRCVKGRTEIMWRRTRPSSGSCVQTDEPLDSVQFWEFFDYLSKSWLLDKPCFFNPIR